MTYRFGLLIGLVAAAGCFADPPSSSTSAAESSTGAVVDPSTSGETGVGSSSSSSSPASSTTGGPVGSCGAAQSPEACAAASDPNFEACAWFPTWSHEALSCEPFDTGSGACIIEQGLDGCGEPEPTCDDGRSIYYRVVGEVVEVVDATSLCYGLSDFEPCPVGASEGGSSSVGSTTGMGSGGTDDTGFGDTGTSGFGEAGGSFGSTGAWSLEDEIAAVCACAC